MFAAPASCAKLVITMPWVPATSLHALTHVNNDQLNCAYRKDIAIELLLSKVN